MLDRSTLFPMCALVVALVPEVAQAQEIDMSPPAGSTSSSSSSSTTAAPVATGDAAAFHKGTMGLSFPITLLSNISSGVGGVTERVQTINFVYFANEKEAVDLIGGINFHRKQTSDAAGMKTDTNLFGFVAGLGYRVYSSKDNLRTYVEPQILLTWLDTADSDGVAVEGAVQFGVERNLSSWFSFSGAIGAGLAFSNGFNDIQLATEATLAANLYWR